MATPPYHALTRSLDGEAPRERMERAQAEAIVQLWRQSDDFVTHYGDRTQHRAPRPPVDDSSMIEAFHALIASPMTTDEDTGPISTTYMAYLMDTRGLSREDARGAVDADERAWRNEAVRRSSTKRLAWNDFKDAFPYLVVTLVLLGIYVVIEFLFVAFVWRLRHVVDPIPPWLWLLLIVGTPALTWLVIRIRKQGWGPVLTYMFAPPLITAVAVLLGVK